MFVRFARKTLDPCQMLQVAAFVTSKIVFQFRSLVESRGESHLSVAGTVVVIIHVLCSLSLSLVRLIVSRIQSCSSSFARFEVGRDFVWTVSETDKRLCIWKLGPFNVCVVLFVALVIERTLNRTRGEA
jgi:hypothetical protein